MATYAPLRPYGSRWNYRTPSPPPSSVIEPISPLVTATESNIPLPDRLNTLDPEPAGSKSSPSEKSIHGESRAESTPMLPSLASVRSLSPSSRKFASSLGDKGGNYSEVPTFAGNRYFDPLAFFADVALSSADPTTLPKLQQLAAKDAAQRLESSSGNVSSHSVGVENAKSCNAVEKEAPRKASITSSPPGDKRSTGEESSASVKASASQQRSSSSPTPTERIELVPTRDLTPPSSNASNSGNVELVSPSDSKAGIALSSSPQPEPAILPSPPLAVYSSVPPADSEQDAKVDPPANSDESIPHPNIENEASRTCTSPTNVIQSQVGEAIEDVEESPPPVERPVKVGRGKKKGRGKAVAPIPKTTQPSTTKPKVTRSKKARIFTQSIALRRSTRNIKYIEEPEFPASSSPNLTIERNSARSRTMTEPQTAKTSDIATTEQTVPVEATEAVSGDIIENMVQGTELKAISDNELEREDSRNPSFENSAPFDDIKSVPSDVTHEHLDVIEHADAEPISGIIWSHEANNNTSNSSENMHNAHNSSDAHIPISTDGEDVNNQNLPVTQGYSASTVQPARDHDIMSIVDEVQKQMLGSSLTESTQETYLSYVQQPGFPSTSHISSQRQTSIPIDPLLMEPSPTTVLCENAQTDSNGIPDGIDSVAPHSSTLAVSDQLMQLVPPKQEVTDIVASSPSSPRAPSINTQAIVDALQRGPQMMPLSSSEPWYPPCDSMDLSPEEEPVTSSREQTAEAAQGSDIIPAPKEEIVITEKVELNAAGTEELHDGISSELSPAAVPDQVLDEIPVAIKARQLPEQTSAAITSTDEVPEELQTISLAESDSFVNSGPSFELHNSQDSVSDSTDSILSTPTAASTSNDSDAGPLPTTADNYLIHTTIIPPAEDPRCEKASITETTISSSDLEESQAHADDSNFETDKPPSQFQETVDVKTNIVPEDQEKKSQTAIIVEHDHIQSPALQSQESEAVGTESTHDEEGDLRPTEQLLIEDSSVEADIQYPGILGAGHEKNPSTSESLPDTSEDESTKSTSAEPESEVAESVLPSTSNTLLSGVVSNSPISTNGDAAIDAPDALATRTVLSDVPATSQVEANSGQTVNQNLPDSPSSNDLCLVCKSSAFVTQTSNPVVGESSAEPQPGAGLSTQWIECDGCKLWSHSGCVNLSSEDVEAIDKYHCASCEKHMGPSTLVRKSARPKVPIDYESLNNGSAVPVQSATNKLYHPYVDKILSGEFKTIKEEFPRVVPEELSLQFFEDGGGFRVPIVIPAAINRYPRKGKSNSASETPKPSTTNFAAQANAINSGERQFSVAVEIPVSAKEEMEFDALGMGFPENLTIRQVVDLVGPDETVEVIDVKSQQGDKRKWPLSKWVEYFEDPNKDRIYNVISLEVSRSRLGRMIQRPTVVRELDLSDQVWPKDKMKEFPNVQYYCLMSVAHAYTDWHVDFGGSSVYYRILKGKKVFFFMAPTEDNLEAYHKWATSAEQNWTWLAEGRECYRVELGPGDTMLIPSGWLHAVYTPEDSLVIGGNFLTRLHYEMQFRIHEIERLTNTPIKYRFPRFARVHWYDAIKLMEDDPIPPHVEDQLLSGKAANFRSVKGKGSAANLSDWVLEGLPSFTEFLRRNSLIAQEIITEGFTKQKTEAIRHAIPKGHGDGWELVQRFARWVTWKRNCGEVIPSWAYPDADPAEGIPNAGQKKLSAAAIKHMERAKADAERRAAGAVRPGLRERHLSSYKSPSLANTPAPDELRALKRSRAYGDFGPRKKGRTQKETLDQSVVDECVKEVVAEYESSDDLFRRAMAAEVKAQYANVHITRLGPSRSACAPCRDGKTKCKHKDEIRNLIAKVLELYHTVKGTTATDRQSMNDHLTRENTSEIHEINEHSGDAGHSMSQPNNDNSIRDNAPDVRDKTPFNATDSQNNVSRKTPKPKHSALREQSGTNMPRRRGGIRTACDACRKSRRRCLHRLQAAVQPVESGNLDNGTEGGGSPSRQELIDNGHKSRDISSPPEQIQDTASDKHGPETAAPTTVHNNASGDEKSPSSRYATPSEQPISSEVSTEVGKEPEPDTNAPEETARTPEATAQTPDETVQTPEETAETPEETAQTPEETAETPEETAETPEEIAQTPEETAQSPEAVQTPQDEHENTAVTVPESTIPTSSQSDVALTIRGRKRRTFDVEEKASSAKRMDVKQTKTLQNKNSVTPSRSSSKRRRPAVPIFEEDEEECPKRVKLDETETISKISPKGRVISKVRTTPRRAAAAHQVGDQWASPATEIQNTPEQIVWQELKVSEFGLRNRSKSKSSS